MSRRHSHSISPIELPRIPMSDALKVSSNIAKVLASSGSCPIEAEKHHFFRFEILVMSFGNTPQNSFRLGVFVTTGLVD